MPSLNGIKHRLSWALKFGRYDHRSVFTKIFNDRYWGDHESVSGIGSRMGQTENIRHELPRVFRQFGVETLFDAPCGDLNWMKAVLAETQIGYIGGDIVPEVLALARENSPDPAYEFRIFDITTDAFPQADMWLCRDVLFHLSFANIWKALENFCRSDVAMMMVTTHTDADIVNRNILTGDFRHINLFKAPFSFPEDMVIDRFADYAAPLPPRDMILIRREDLAQHLKTRGR